MKRRSSFVAVTFAAMLCMAVPAIGAGKEPLKLFGVTLKAATRDQLRQAFKQSGLRVIREDSRYWADEYDASGILDGASKFTVGYVEATGKFAFAKYTFAGFMNTQLVGKVINMVTMKYGRPSSQSGSYGLGQVTAKWAMGHGMQIEVSRGWPDTTTLLTFRDINAEHQMAAEIKANDKANQRQKAKEQSNAF